MPSPLIEVSTLIPCHNTAIYLRKTIESVLSQSCPPVEVILVDDGSTDDTWSIILELASQHKSIKPLKLSSNQGVVAARNAGLALARGDYIAMLDSDDIWTPDALAVRMDQALRFPQADLIATDFAWLEDIMPAEPIGRICLGPRGRDAFGHSCLSQEPMLIEYPFEVTATTHFVWTGATLVKRSAIQAIGNFDPAFKGPEDTLLWLRLAQRGAFVFCPRVTALYRQRPGSLVTLLKGPKEMFFLQVLNYLRPKPEYESYRPVIDRLAAECHVEASQHFGNAGVLGLALRHALHALLLNPTGSKIWRHLISSSLDFVRAKLD